MNWPSRGNSIAQSNSRAPIAVIGAGLAGSLAALDLGRQGYRVLLVDQRPLPSMCPALTVQHIVLTPSTCSGLEQRGFGKALRQLAAPLRGRMFHTRAGRCIQEDTAGSPARDFLRQRPGSHGISKCELLAVLHSALEDLSNVEFAGQRKLVGLDSESGDFDLEDTTGQRQTHCAEIVIAADGASSATRSLLVQSGCIHEVCIPSKIGLRVFPAQACSGAALDPNFTHFWPRRGFTLIGIPDGNQDFVFAFFYRLRVPTEVAVPSEQRDLAEFMGHEFPDIAPWLAVDGDGIQRLVLRMRTVTCQPWSVGRVALVGDACHAMLPFAGQGANTALGDAECLAQCLVCHDDYREGFAAYEAQRRPLANNAAVFSAALEPIFLDLMGALPPSMAAPSFDAAKDPQLPTSGKATRKPTSLSA